MFYLFGPAILCEVGRRDIERRQHERGLSWLNVARLLRPADMVVNYQMSRVLRRLNRPQQASSHLEVAVKNDLPADLHEREQVLQGLKVGTYPQSIQAWRDLLQSAGSDLPEVCEAFVLFRLSRFETVQAIELLEAWEQQYPTDARCLQLKGGIYELLEKWRPAIESYEQAASFTDKNQAILVDLAGVRIHQLQYDQAIVDLRVALKDGEPILDLSKAGGGGRSLEARVLLATCLLKTGELSEAERVLEKRCKSLEPSADLWAILGELSFQKGDLETAKKFCESSIAVDPARMQSHYLLAQTLDALGDKQGAKSEFDFVRTATTATTKIAKLTAELVSSPKDVELRYEIGSLAWQYQSRANGLRWLTELLQVDPLHQPTHRLLAEHYDETGNIALANFHRSQLTNQD